MLTNIVTNSEQVKHQYGFWTYTAASFCAANCYLSYACLLSQDFELVIFWQFW